MNDGLIVPKQIEYLIVKRPRRRWHLAAILASVLIAVGVGIVLVVRHYKEPHKYPVLQLSAIGLKAALRTKWLSGSGHYTFQVRPTPGNETRFAAIVEKIPRNQIEFNIHLLDSDGFELCSAVALMHARSGPDGKPTAMTADSYFPNCTEEQIRTATRWHVSYRFPLLGADINPPTAASAVPDVTPRAQLTGADFSTGEVETVDAGSFRVVKKADYMTLLGWKSPDEIGLSCKGQVCVLTNLRTTESVHARKR